MWNKKQKERTREKDATGLVTGSETIFPKLGMLTTALAKTATQRQKNERRLSQAALRPRRRSRRKYGTWILARLAA